MRRLALLIVFLACAAVARADTNVPVSIAQPFVQGQYPNCVQAFLNGVAVAVTQNDVRSRWPDGSLKFAVISFVMPTYTPGTVLDVSYESTPDKSAASCNNTVALAQTSAQLLGAGYNFDAQIKLTGGSNPSASARTILTAANTAGGCVDPGNDPEGSAALCTYWLKGPVVTAVILEDRRNRSCDMNTDGGGTLGTCGGTPGSGNPLHPIFEAWFYPQTNTVQVGYTLENIWASTTPTVSARAQNYTVTMTIGNSPTTTVYTSGALAHYVRSRWHKVFTLNPLTNTPVIDHNWPYWAQTNFTPSYDPTLVIAPSLITSTLNNFNSSNQALVTPAGTTTSSGNWPVANGGFTDTGDAHAHGPLTTWDTIYLVSQAPSLLPVALGNADLGSAITYFYREADHNAGHGQTFDSSGIVGNVETQGRIVSVNARTQVSLLDTTPNTCNTVFLQDWINYGTGGQNTGPYSLGLNMDTSHSGQVAYVAYLSTGQYFYYEDVMMQGAYSFGAANGNTACTQPTVNSSLRMGSAGYFYMAQERQMTWGLRDLMVAAFIAVDGSPEKAYLEDKLKANVAVMEGGRGLTNDYPTYTTAYSYGQNSRGFCSATPPVSTLYFAGGNSSPLGSWICGLGDYRNNTPPLNASGANAPQAADAWFQASYSGVVIGWLNDLGYCPSKCSLLNLIANHYINTALNPTTSPFHFTEYVYPTLDNNGNAITSWAQNETFYTTPPTTAWPTAPNRDTDDCSSCPSNSTAVLSYMTNITSSQGGYSGRLAYQNMRGVLQANGYICTSPGFDFCSHSPKFDIVPRSSSTVTTAGPAAPWSGVLDPARAINFGNAGVLDANGIGVGNGGQGIPSANWTQCGSPIAPYTGTAATISNQIATCAANTYVLLSPGTFNLSTGIQMRPNVVVRGSGSNSTFIIATGNNAFNMSTNNSGPNTAINQTAIWSSGFAQNMSQITLTNLTATLSVGQYIQLDQQNDLTDTGNLFVCGTTETYPNCSYEGEASNGRNTENGTLTLCNGTETTPLPPCIYRSQEQMVKITSIVSGCTTTGTGSACTINITPSLYLQNWSASKIPGAFWANVQNGIYSGAPNTITNAGIESLSVDGTNEASDTDPIISVVGASNCWISDIRSINAPQQHVYINLGSHITVQNSYFYGTRRAASQSYGIEYFQGYDSLNINNVFQRVSAPIQHGPGQGNVDIYNFSINNYIGQPTFMSEIENHHDSGVMLNLSESNIGSELYEDNFHGFGGLNTQFRNRWNGHECTNQFTSGTVTAGNTVMNVTAGSLNPGSITVIVNGDYIVVPGAGTGGSNLITTVAGFSTTSNTITLATPAVTSVSNANVSFVTCTTGGAFTVDLRPFWRYLNVVGNVLGTTGIHTAANLPASYQNAALQNAIYIVNPNNLGEQATITGLSEVGNVVTATFSGFPGGGKFTRWSLVGAPTTGGSLNTGYQADSPVTLQTFTSGASGSVTWNSSATGLPACSSSCGTMGTLIPADALTANSLMRWGNYDTANAATRFLASEVPSGISPYGNAVPASQTLPPSFFNTSKPTWWPASKPWPVIGPDITGGNIGICNGGSYQFNNALTAAQCVGGTFTASDAGGHANSNPAMDCYLTTMGGPPDGSGPVLPFDSKACYSPSGAVPTATLTPATVAFGNEPVGTTSPVNTQATFTNTGSLGVNVTAIATSGAPFALSGGTCSTPPFTLAVSSSCTIGMTFAPATATGFTGSLTVTSAATGSPQSIAVTGTGTSSAATLTASIAFGNQNVNTTSTTQLAILSSTGTAPLNVSAISSSSPTIFGLPGGGNCPAPPFALAISTNCTIGVNFTPNAATSFTGTLSVADDAAGSPQTSALSGTGSGNIVAPVLNPSAGTFPTAINVTITTAPPNASATICYTINGVAPTTNGAGTCTGATLTYGGPVAVKYSLTLEAIATQTGFSDSGITTGSYQITIAPPSNLITEQPSRSTIQTIGQTGQRRR